MVRTGQSVLISIVAVLACASLLAADKGSRHKATNASGTGRKTLRTLPAKQEQSALPLSAGQTVPRPPMVTYFRGQLTIVAENSSLADILSAVCKETGAVVDLRPGSGSDRVASRMGPGPARDMLAALLNGSRFDYVMTASPSNPAGVEHIILIARGDGSQSMSPVRDSSMMASPDGQQPSQNITDVEIAQQQSSQQDVSGSATTSDVPEFAGANASEQPTRVMTSEGVAPTKQMPQAYPQQLGLSPLQQPPNNNPGNAKGSPNPPPPQI